MAKTLETRLEIRSWDEKPYRELADGRKFNRADVVLAGDPLADCTFEALMFYRPDGTSTYVTFMYITGALDGRSGSFVLQGEGTYDGTTARSRYTVVEGSGTGELAGLRGTAESASTHEDYPHMPLTLNYDIG
ncbi:MAG: hypothetical protein AUI10_11800 [Actinobacteria bacterium 13_2_20CM_2_72_6]|nr:MAG: hypothetical protein AUI10_11800 [Actinobacteria bacterium 13_2_20CM_2_72_6]